MNKLEMSQSQTEKNKALVLEAFDTLFNQRDYAGAERYWSPDYIQHSAHIEPGREGLFNLIKSLPPTLRYEPGTIVAEGDFVIVHGRFSGFGAPVNWIAADILRIQDGILVEHWDVIQDEATEEQSKSKAPMLEQVFRNIPLKRQPKTKKGQNMSNKHERELAGKVALVTGGSRGIGAAIAERLAADGASVAVTYSKGADAAASVVKAIERAGGKAVAIQGDAADADAVRNAVERTVTTFGRLDVLVNNAGTVIPMKVEETTLADFDRVFAVNVRGAFVATQAALKHIKSGGRIIMIGSCLGERVLIPGMAPYSATKGAIKMFTQGLARELGARGITVNNVQPGPIDTDLNPASGEWAVGQKAVVPLDRYGHADEVAALVAFVAGPESSYINGANLTVDGGTNA